MGIIKVDPERKITLSQEQRSLLKKVEDKSWRHFYESSITESLRTINLSNSILSSYPQFDPSNPNSLKSRKRWDALVSYVKKLESAKITLAHMERHLKNNALEVERNKCQE